MASSYARRQALETTYASAKRQAIKDMCRIQADSAVWISRAVKGGKAIADSKLNATMFYEKLERNMRKKGNEVQQDRFGRVKDLDPADMDLSQFEPDVAWVIAEDRIRGYS